NGQFAIALWDAPRRRLVLARDRVGIRPLLYASIGNRLVFASEAKSLFASNLVTARLDCRALAQVCSYWAPLAPATAFEGVRALPPGHLLVLERGEPRLRQYWDWRFPSRGTDAPSGVDDASDRVRELLQSAVRLRLRSDVEVGAYLSGGLDSATVSAFASATRPSGLQTFSLAFDDAEFDERLHQREMAAHLGCVHHTREITASEVGAAFPRAVYHIETPIVRTAPVPMMLLAERVRDQGLKVVLTGEGADEVFAGYDIFKEAMVRRFAARQPHSTARPRLLRRLYRYLAYSPTAHGALSTGFFRQSRHGPESACFAHAPRWESTYRTARFFSPELRAALGDWDACRSFSETVPSDFARWAPLCRDQYVEAHTLLSGYLLGAQGDRVAMAHSVETRYPFLDHRLIEFANTLPPPDKLQGLREKRILKAAVRDLLPASVVARVKQPYRAPDGVSFFSQGAPLEYVADLLSSASLRDAGYFEPEAVGRLVRKFQEGAGRGFADNMSLVAIVSTMLVHEQFVRGRPV
ncbi:MAG: asparagine synthase (glutamine-hydrolyzing), partial [Acidobacteriota bacterium]|nr:asparagine synthase (glutamine-hydrolyzing) [Acidobacteriota bacterium]